MKMNISSSNMDSSNRSNDEETNAPETNAEVENLPEQHSSVRVRRQPNRLNYDILGGQNLEGR